MLDQLLELGRYLDLEVLIEARLDAKIIRQRWPIIQLRHIALQLLFAAIQFGGLAVQLLLSAL